MRKHANSKSCPITTVFLSFLKHERERDFAIVSERLSCTVWTFLSVQRFMTISELFGHQRSETVMIRSWNGHETLYIPFLLILLFGYESDQTKKHDLWTESSSTTSPRHRFLGHTRTSMHRQRPAQLPWDRFAHFAERIPYATIIARPICVNY